LKLPASAVVLSDAACDAIDRLEASSTPVHRAVARRARALNPILLDDCLHGEVVRRGALPRILQAKHGLENLYVEDLPGFWRLLYTIVVRDRRRVIVIVEIVSHRDYSKWFPGRGR
jgi:hypothetical protein